MQSVYPMEFISGAVNINGDNGLFVDSQGAMSFTAGEDLSILSDGSISLATDNIFSVEARTGDINIFAGNELVYSAAGKFKADGTHGASLSTQGDLNVIGGRTARITSNTADTLIKNNGTFEYSVCSL